MAVLQHDRPRAGRRPAIWTWVAIALVPVGLGLGVVLAFSLGEGAQAVLPGLLPGLVALAAPVVAVVLAGRTARAGHRSDTAAIVVAALLLLATLVALPTLIYSVEGFVLVVSVVVLAALVAALAVTLVRSHRRHRPS